MPARDVSPNSGMICGRVLVASETAISGSWSSNRREDLEAIARQYKSFLLENAAVLFSVRKTECGKASNKTKNVEEG